MNRLRQPILIGIKRYCCQTTNLPYSKKHFLDDQFENFKSVFKNFSFSGSQIYSINKFLKKRDNLQEFNTSDLTEALNFWNTTIHVDPYLTIGRTSNHNEKINVNSVLTQHPELILINVKEMEARVKKLQELGIFSGTRDMFRIFVIAPKGFFLQDWQDFLKKFYYIHYRIIEWLIGKNKNKYPDPHPIVNDPEVMEKSYEHIKARYLFTIYTGHKSPGRIVYNEPDLITLKSMLLYELEYFLKLVASGCSEEEYTVFEDMVSDTEDEEDKILDEIIQLGGKAEDAMKESYERMSISFLSSFERKKLKPRVLID